MKETSGKVMTGYIAKWYDFRAPFNGVNSINRKQLELLDVDRNDRILDIGCGTGKIVKALYNKCGDNVKLFGLDPSQDMIQVAMRKFDPDVNGVQFRVGVAERLPFDGREVRAYRPELAQARLHRAGPEPLLQ